MFPKENFHYRKNVKVVGGVDLNIERFTSEQMKHFLNRYPESLQQNTPFYLTALAARKYAKYMEMVHGMKKEHSP